RLDEEWDREQIARWQEIHDRAYQEPAPSGDSRFNTAGWNSTYTGQPIPANEMREQVDATVKRILALRPERVLEIGCGTGLLLHRLAPHCESYCATDISSAAIGYLRDSIGTSLPHVQLQLREADDVSGIEPGFFDVVVLNSVIQYFPSLTYLERVM